MQSLNFDTLMALSSLPITSMRLIGILDCIIKLFSRGVTAKSRPAVTDEKAIKASREFVQGYISAIATPWTFIESLQHRTTKEEV